MAIVRESSTLTEGNGVTSLAVTKPTGLANGNVLVVALCIGATGMSAPAGFTQFVTFSQDGTVVIWGFHKVITDAANEPATYSFSGWAAARSTAIAVRYSGVDNTTPIDVTASTAGNTGGGTTLAAPSITTVTNGAMLVAIGGQNSSTGTVTVPGTMSQIQQSTGTGRRCALADETFATAGATGTRTFTFNSATLAHAVFLGALRPASGAHTVTVTQITETDTAQAITAVKTPITVAVGQVTETNTAQVITVVAPKNVLVGQVTETDTAQIISAVKAPLNIAVNQISEVDTAQSIAAVKVVAVGQVIETDTAQSFTALNAPLTVSVGQAVETDTAMSIDPGGPKIRQVTQVIETDTAQSVIAVKTILKAVGQVIETDTSFVVSVSKNSLLGTVGQVIEIQEALAVGVARIYSFGQAIETDFAMNIAGSIVVFLGTPGELSGLDIATTNVQGTLDPAGRTTSSLDQQTKLSGIDSRAIILGE